MNGVQGARKRSGVVREIRMLLRYAAWAGCLGRRLVFMSPIDTPIQHMSAFSGDTRESARALPAQLYIELRRIAQSLFSGEASDHTLSRTAVIHEAWMRLAKQPMPAAPTDFLRLAARVMRNVLVDHARARNAIKRGGDLHVTSLDQTIRNYARECATGLYMQADDTSIIARIDEEFDLCALDSAIKALELQSARQAQVVELKFFAGLSMDEIAAQLDTSLSTVKREWSVARLFLLRELSYAHTLDDGGTDWRGVLSWEQRGLDISQASAASNPASAHLADTVATAHLDVSAVAGELDPHALAAQHAAAAVAVRERLYAADSADAGRLSSLAYALASLAETQSKLPDVDPARATLARARKVFEQWSTDLRGQLDMVTAEMGVNGVVVRLDERAAATTRDANQREALCRSAAAALAAI